jgi:hypothetical protein
VTQQYREVVIQKRLAASEVNMKRTERRRFVQHPQPVMGV